MFSTWVRSPSTRAASCTSLTSLCALGFVGLTRIPIAPTDGATSRKSSSRFGHERVEQEGHAGHVAPRSIEGSDKTHFYRIAANCENDRNRRRSPLRGERSKCSATDEDNRRVAANEISR